MKKILIFPAGTEIAFEILNALKFSKFVEVYGGTSATDHSEFVYERLIDGFPYINEPGFVDYLNDIIDQYALDCIYPAHDSVSVVLSENRDRIHAQVIVTDVDTVHVCRSKPETYRFFQDTDFIPEMFQTPEQVPSFPVFVKPAVGQGSRGAKLIQTSEMLEQAIAADPSLVICEYLPGMEYTVDCFTDRNGNLRIVNLRDRQRIKAGIAVRSSRIPLNEKINSIAATINSRLHFRGAWFFQVKRNLQGEYRLLEISPRIPGTMGLSRNCGINFPMLTLFDFWDYDIEIIDNGYDITVDRAFYNAYRISAEYEHIYLDYDDTVIINGAVNSNLMMFLYQARQRGKKIHLLSKHIGDLHADLQKYAISEQLFSSITVIPPQQKKIDYIQEKKSIFIDDSFAERLQVHTEKHIPVFDVDMIECLIDWRR